MNGTTFTPRLWAFAAALIALMAMALPSTASAQYKCGGCDVIQVYGTDNIPCKFTVCVNNLITGTQECKVISPGVITYINCPGYVSITIKDCNGIIHTVTEACTGPIPMGNGCCIDACLFKGGSDCLIVKIGLAATPCHCNS